FRKGKDIFNTIQSTGALDKIKGAVLKELSESRKEYDEASFNYAVSLSDNAGLFESEERYQKHKKLFLEVLKSTDSEDNTPLENAANLNDAGEMLYASGRFHAAEASFNKAKKIYEEEGQTASPLYAQVISNLGLLYHTTGRYATAEEFTLKALNLRKEIFKQEENSIYASSINNIGVLYKDMGRYNEAEQLLSKTVAVNEQTLGKKSVPYAISLNNLAMLFQAMGRLNAAEPILKEAITVAGETLKEKSTNYVRLMVNLALLYQEMGKYPEADDIYQKAIKIKERKLGTNHPDYAHLLNNLASLYMLMNKQGEVETLLKKAMGIYKKKFGENHPSYASTISNLGNFYRVSDRLDEAETYLKQTLQIRKETLGENHPEYVNALENMALLYWQKGQLQESSLYFDQVLTKVSEQINLYFAPMSEAEKTKFWDKVRPKFQRFNAFASEAYKEDPTVAGKMFNYQLATKALLLNATNKVKNQILSSGDQQLIKEYLSWLDDKENLARLYTLSKAELQEEKINLDSLEKAANAKEKALSSKSQLFSSGYIPEKISYEEIRKKLGPQEAVVEIIQLHKFNKIFTDTVWYATLVLTSDRPEPELILLENGNQLEKRYFAYYKNAIRQKVKDEHSYQQYWKKVENSISNKKTIYVSPDGVYNQINLNTLTLPDGRFLVDVKNVVLVTNSKEIIGLKSTTNQSTALTATLVGFPDYGNKGTITPLPGTKAEIEALKKMLASKSYKTTVYTGAEANEEKVKSINAPRILHIATHGFFIKEVEGAENEKVFGIELAKSKENPLLRAGLMLAGAEKAIEGTSENGILTAYELMNLLLDNTELVVLSACETGLGDVKNGEGVYGLQRAFQVAGAKSIIMSLWKVNDDATQQLMSSFYKNYLLHNDKQKAFKSAQLELKSKFKDPYFWGAFVLVE
ncbi:MAG TPA: CHAT domain-containing tetratricopeptide repeat protein, partial [Cytophagaceae bacterium]